VALVTPHLNPQKAVVCREQLFIFGKIRANVALSRIQISPEEGAWFSTFDRLDFPYVTVAHIYNLCIVDL
jgi:hypothetical protein